MAELQGGQSAVLLAQARRTSAGAPARRADQPSDPTPSTGCVSAPRYDGTLIVISHDRHFPNGVCSIADIDYQTIITYGGYDDMVVAKTQIRSTLESQNAQREPKIAQLNDLSRDFAGRHAVEPCSRGAEVERLQTTDLARSNIQRPYIRFTTARLSGGGARVHGRVEVRRHAGRRSTPSSIVARKSCHRRNGVGKTTLLKALLADAPGPPITRRSHSGAVRWGHEV